MVYSTTPLRKTSDCSFVGDVVGRFGEGFGDIVGRLFGRCLGHVGDIWELILRGV